MSELINNIEKKKELLKHMILQLHEGTAPEAVRAQLVRLLGDVPYNTVVEVEQELISQGLPAEEVLRLCDVHTEALQGAISQAGAKSAPVGHPVHTFKEENRALAQVTGQIQSMMLRLNDMNEDDEASSIYLEFHARFNELMDVEKHYLRKENLLFPFLEAKEITGPPKVMWGKHDETRELLKAAQEVFQEVTTISVAELKATAGLVFKQVVDAIEGMIQKEEEILFPMCLDTLDDGEWHQIHRQSPELGFCLYDPTEDWKPDRDYAVIEEVVSSDRVALPSGSFAVPELLAVLNTMPFDITFVDKDDRVRYFSQGKERIFARNRAILGRKVQMCHPPSSVHIVQQILDDFRSGREESARFWITLGGKFILIEYYALRDKKGEYLGTLEVSQDLTEKRQLEGERRLLKYDHQEN